MEKAMTLISGGQAKRKAPATTQAVNMKIIRKPDLSQKVGLSHTTIWRFEKEGKFPKRLRLGGGACGWLEHEIDEWLTQRAAER